MEPQDVVKAQLMDASDLERTLNRMARQIIELITPNVGGTEAGLAKEFALIGMQTRGVHLARRLQAQVEEEEAVEVPVGVLDVTMYRDDIRQPSPAGRSSTFRSIRATEIPFDVTGRHVVLVDDVLYTGRTARAALGALMDLGRPASVHFLVIVDRGLRELPICADIVGREVPTLPGEEVRVRLEEVDDREGVWLVENPEAYSQARSPQ